MGPNNVPGWSNFPLLNFQIADRNFTVEGRGPQIGVLSVGDLLFNQVVEFHFGGSEAGNISISEYGAECTAEKLEQAGLERIGQEGHWVQGSNAPDGIFNGPVVHIGFSSSLEEEADNSIHAFAQFDTGLDDSVWNRTIIVNRPLLEMLQGLAKPPVPHSTAVITDCTGTERTQQVFLPQGNLRIENQEGHTIREVADYHILFQDAAPSCGGISGADGPAAQIGASYLREFGTTVFVGQRKEVWVASAQN